jgi:deoxyribodipyrimidine photo-lyase
MKPVPANEKAAIAKLRQFCKQGAGEYDARRDFPPLKAQAAYRPAWRWASFPRQCLHRLLAEQPQALDGGRARCG